jgi:hypothetical protein
MVYLVSSFQFGLHASLRVGEESKETFNITGIAEITPSPHKMKEQMISNSTSSITKTQTHWKRSQKHHISGEEKGDNSFHFA